MTIRLMAITMCMAWTTSMFAGEPMLVNPKPVFSTSQPAYKGPNQYHDFSMRLSPDGKRVLYTRPVAGSEQSDQRSSRSELVLRELDGGKETVLLIGSLDSGWRTVFTRFNMFDSAGKRLVLPDISAQPTSASTTGMKWLIYDIAQAKATNTDIADGIVLAKFAADGQALVTTVGTGPRELATRIISLKTPKAEPKLLTAPGYIQSICPTGDAAAFFVPPARSATQTQPATQTGTPSTCLVLWDLKADKELAQIPTHPRNSMLDDWETQWTADGRYLYYGDVEEIAAEEQSGRPSYRYVTRIWDKQAGQLAGAVRDAVPVGPGPGPSLMVLAKHTQNPSGGFLLHDASRGTELPLGDASKSLIHAYGGKVIYAEKLAGSDAEDVFSADLVIPKP